ncbi:G protein-regulated inducer of neurite outgrowth 1 [Channa argus]|uniref:G protein-regulated inducer of neurite outgrowth 1 n=1 Tax=Channa argus TaxID=215402 RepID=UPI0029475675|nr:hypothetical protein Q8A73_010608 [Channa argus]
MGSLKDEMKGLREDHQLCEKTDDGEHPGGSGDSAVPERPQKDISQEDCQPKLQMNASYDDDAGKNSKSKDQMFSAGGCDTVFIQIKDCAQAEAIPLTQEAEADETTVATHSDATISGKFLTEGDSEIQSEKSKSTAQEREKDVESIMMAVPSTPDPFDPRSPAPFGQHHVRTQVSLEVVQCRSAATSPMTPPEGKNSFIFPSSFGRSEGVGTGTKDAELQVGHQVEFCSVATSPMTPKTPSTTAFPELVGRETVKQSEEHRKSGQQESCPDTTSPAEAESEKTQALKFKPLNELTEDFKTNSSPESSASCMAAGKSSQVTVEDSNQQCKQQRMGSMDQDITILVTQYGNNGEEVEEAESSLYSIEPEMVKIDECEELNENKNDVQREDREEIISAKWAAPDHISNTKLPQKKTEESSVPAREQPTISSEVKENKNVREELKDATKPPVPESPAPFGCHNIRTQVSLEIVQCQSAATSPMTPPEGEQAFYFPSSFGKCGTKDAELQVGQQVEFRSVATAPMTPRTPITTTFPEIRKATSIEEKIVEEEEDKKEQPEDDKEKGIKEEEKVTEQKVETAEEDVNEAINCKEKGEEKCEEPVQELNWDEKGMTWEVYGAVVEVAVLGSAIQKHLEKQVKKQKKTPSMPPPPPLTPSATPLTSESSQGGSGSGKGQAGKRAEQDGKVRRRRRNPFRLLMENMQQPHCCSRAHTTE